MHTSALILSERLRRHRLIAPLQDRQQYQALFALLQPVAPIYFSYPGTPPRLVHRTAFDDGVEAERLRAVRTIVKGRFLGGTCRPWGASRQTRSKRRLDCARRR